MSEKSYETLKPGWHKLKLSDLCEEISERVSNPSVSDFDRFVGLDHMETGETKLRKFGGTSDLVSAMKLFKAGDILVARRNVYLKRAALAEFDGVCSGDAIVLRPQNNPRVAEGILQFILNTDSFWDYAVKHAAGTMSKRLSVENLLSYEFSLPSLTEQLRFVQLLQAVETNIENLTSLVSAEHQLKRSVRDHLFSNGLSSQSESIHGLVFPIPSGWEVRALTSIVDGRYGLVDGPFGSNLKSEHYRTEGIPVIQSAFVAKGWFDKSAAQYVFVDQEKYESEIRSSVGPGDIVMVKIGVNCGACARMPADHQVGILAGNCLKIRVAPDICRPQFLLHYLHWLKERNVLNRLIHSTQQKALSLANLKSVAIGIPSIDEQDAIAAILDDCDASIAMTENRLLAARHMLKQITAALEVSDV